mmetsp:Transcript_50614/g.120743  ORF Transcript_50614/g.120743 Transcript_50614/m.120743 type:complete len:228 (-) Transcript_50614:746-1429(-)
MADSRQMEGPDSAYAHRLAFHVFLLADRHSAGNVFDHGRAVAHGEPLGSHSPVLDFRMLHVLLGDRPGPAGRLPWFVWCSLCPRLYRSLGHLLSGRGEHQSNRFGAHGARHLRTGRLLEGGKGAAGPVEPSIPLKAVVCLRACSLPHCKPEWEAYAEPTIRGKCVRDDGFGQRHGCHRVPGYGTEQDGSDVRCECLLIGHAADAGSSPRYAGRVAIEATADQRPCGV